jgi:hypothetical protein
VNSEPNAPVSRFSGIEPVVIGADHQRPPPLHVEVGDRVVPVDAQQAQERGQVEIREDGQNGQDDKGDDDPVHDRSPNSVLEARPLSGAGASFQDQWPGGGTPSAQGGRGVEAGEQRQTRPARYGQYLPITRSIRFEELRLRHSPRGPRSKRRSRRHRPRIRRAFPRTVRGTQPTDRWSRPDRPTGRKEPPGEIAARQRGAHEFPVAAIERGVAADLDAKALVGTAGLVRLTGKHGRMLRP